MTDRQRPPAPGSAARARSPREAPRPPPDVALRKAENTTWHEEDGDDDDEAVDDLIAALPRRCHAQVFLQGAHDDGADHRARRRVEPAEDRKHQRGHRNTDVYRVAWI